LAEHASVLARGAKGLVPVSLKTFYHRQVPKSVTRRLAQPPVPVPEWDWGRTRAFSIPTDQHGWIRINLAGRESQGSVARADYHALCADIRDRLLTLASPEGPLVRDVAITAESTGEPPRALPDLVVHWTRYTERSTLRVIDPPLETRAIGLKLTSQHDDHGFFVVRPAGTGAWPATVDATELGRRIGAMV